MPVTDEEFQSFRDGMEAAVQVRLKEQLDGFMGRFFAEAQTLLHENKVGLEGIVRLRNALYGPKVPEIDVQELLRHHGELRTKAYKLIGMRRPL